MPKKHRVGDGPGPEREQIWLDSAEWSIWWCIVGRLLAEEIEEFGGVRPAFSWSVGQKYLEENW